MANLKPWKKGESGNPNGRPKKRTVTDSLRDQLGETPPDEPGGGTWADRIALALLREAAGGNIQAIREVNDRIDGKARQSVAIDDQRAEPLSDDAASYLAGVMPIIWAFFRLNQDRGRSQEVALEQFAEKWQLLLSVTGMTAAEVYDCMCAWEAEI